MLERLRLLWHSWTTRSKMERVFSRREDPYGYATSPYEKERLAAMEAAIAGRRWRHAVELGCAEGLFTERLAASAERVTALDISPRALSRARQRLDGRGVAWAEGDLRSWAGPPEHVDLVVLGDVLYYLDKPLVRDQFAQALGRAARWLARGGRLVLAHGFAGPIEKTIRQGYRRAFEDSGLRLVSERVVGTGEERGEVCCLLSVLERP